MLSWGYLAVQFKRVLPRKSFLQDCSRLTFPLRMNPSYA